MQVNLLDDGVVDTLESVGAASSVHASGSPDASDSTPIYCRQWASAARVDDAIG